MRIDGKLGDVKDPSQVEEGIRITDWAAREMPVVKRIRERFEKDKPLKGIRIAACLHVTTETANLILALKAGGAEISMCASNPLSTQDPVAAALTLAHDIPTYAIKGEDNDTYYRHINAVIDSNPELTIDDGADLVSVVHTDRRESLKTIFGGTEETTTGVVRLRSMALEGVLKYPIVAVNDAETKHLFDNRYGTGQSTLDGITRATNVLWAGKNVVVAGYGWCGKGIANRARGMGAQVIVTEVNPVRALEALMDGYRVMPMTDAASIGQIFITVTGGLNALTASHFQAMRDEVLIANSGHFNVEINIEALEDLSARKNLVGPMITQYVMPNGCKLNLLADGRLVNLAAAEGHPSAVMDMSFANQAMSIEYLVSTRGHLEPGVYPVPLELDALVAEIKLEAMGITYDTLTIEQKEYLSGWQTGT